MRIIWLIVDAIMEVFFVVLFYSLYALIRLFDRLAESRKAYVIKRHFNGDEAAYEHDKWKNS